MNRGKELLTDELGSKLGDIFDFLVQNREFNEVVQRAGYRREVLPWSDTGSKLRSLLHSKANTQTSPKLDVLQPTWLKLHQNFDKFEKVKSPRELNEALWTLARPNVTRDPVSGQVFEEMWTALNSAAGFGSKTAALFVKSIVEIHTLEINRELRFLPDVSVGPEDRFKVPVDTVIQHIFVSLGVANANFNSINALIAQSGFSCAERPTLWDDLWFWGFITQRSDNSAGRRNCVNDAKFWSILGAPGDRWEQIHTAAEEFLRLIEPVKS